MSCKAKAKQIVIFLLGLMECILFSLIFVGWSSLVPILEADGIFGNECQLRNSTISNNVTLSTENISTAASTQRPAVQQESSIIKECPQRNVHFNLIYTLTISIYNLCGFPVGWFFDRFGLRITRLIRSGLLITGILMLALATSGTSVLVYSGMIVLGISGSMTVITLAQIGNLFPNARSTVISFYNGSIDTSVVVFQAVKEAYWIGISRKYSLGLLCGLVVFPLLNTLFLLPKYKIYHATEGTEKEKSTGINEKEQGEDRTQSTEGDKDPAAQSSIPRDGVLKQDTTFRRCFCSTYMILLIFWMWMLSLRLYAYFGFQNKVLSFYNGENAEEVGRISSFIQFGGIVVAPIAGVVMDYYMKKNKDICHLAFRPAIAAVVPLSIASALMSTLSVTRMFPSVILQYISAVLLMSGRAFIFATLLCYVFVTFPNKHFGKILGVVFSLYGIFQLVQYALFYWAQGPPYNPVNPQVVLLVMCGLSFVHPIVIGVKHFKTRGTLENTAAKEYPLSSNVSAEVIKDVTPT